LNPKHVTLLQGLGLSLYNQRKYSEAEKTFRRGLEIEPEHQALLDCICLASFCNKDLEAARSYNEKYLKVAPERSEKVLALVDLGAIGILQKDYAAAEKDLRQALAVDSTSASANLQMGYLFAEQGRYAEAKTFAEKALAVDTSFPGYSLIAYVLVAGETDIDHGISYAEKAFNSKPKDWPLMGVTYFYNTRYSAGGTRSIPDAAYSYYAIPGHTLGLAYLKKGEYQKAVQYLEQAAALAPKKQALRGDLQLAKQKLQERANQ